MKVIALLPLAIVASCSKPLALEGLPCPCVPGYTCDTRRSICVRDDTMPQDAPAPTIDAAAPPDVAPVACSGDDDCKRPPNLCAMSGTCDQGLHECVFPAVDCSSQDTCGSFGGCENADPEDVCDSGSKSRTCMDFTCQPSTGLCIASTRTETAQCSGITNERPCGYDGQPILCTSCDYSDVCDTEASQTCAFAHEKCEDDVCVRQADEMRSVMCSRSEPADPEDACGPPTTSACTPCLNPSNRCAAADGEQLCVLTHHGCVGGACGSIPGGAVTQSCTPGNQEGLVCALCGSGQNGQWTCISGVCVNQCSSCIRDGDGEPSC